jgi:hypothetical protein
VKPRARPSVVSSSLTDRLPLSEEVARFPRHAEAKGLYPATVRCYRQRPDLFVRRNGIRTVEAFRHPLMTDGQGGQPHTSSCQPAADQQCAPAREKLFSGRWAGVRRTRRRPVGE